MALRMAKSYGPQTTQMNEKSAHESSLDLTLKQHLHDEDPELRKVCTHFEINPP
jgi:hypothetical protein